MFIFHLWFLDVKYIWFTFKLNLCNYYDVILHKIMWFVFELMNIEFYMKVVQTYETW
jgi:hypothetical protein